MRYVRTPKVAEHTGLSESFFNNARVTGDGPAFIKVGKAVLYDLDAVDQWMLERQQWSTSAAPKNTRHGHGSRDDTA